MATTKHEKINFEIPHDLIFDILSKLSIKSLKRFSCVTPSWADLFENHNFMMMYHHNFLGNNDQDTSILLRVRMSYTVVPHAFMLYDERFEKKIKLDWPPAIHEDEINRICKFGDIVNGIICLYKLEDDWPPPLVGPTIPLKVVLWNLSSNESKVLPQGHVHCPLGTNMYHNLRGFGYDNFTNDYKIIRLIYYFYDNLGNGDIEDPLMPSWQLYSLKSNSWKTLNIKMPFSTCIHEVYLNGMCHWWGEKIYNKGKWVLVSFNLSDEVSYTTPLDWNDCYDILNSSLVVMNDSIAMITMHKGTTCFDISILGELGVRKSWTKIFTIGPLPFVSYPIEGWNKGKVFFKTKNGELYWFDLSTQVIEEIGVQDYGDSEIAIYKKSLMSIGWING